MAKEKNKTKEQIPTGKAKYIKLFESELVDLGMKKETKTRELSNLIREKLGLPEVTAVRSSKRREVKLALGLSEDATQKEINDAILERLAK